MIGEPDFTQLGVETPHSAQEWRAAWDLLGNDASRLWPTVLELSRSPLSLRPTGAAANLKAYVGEEWCP